MKNSIKRGIALLLAIMVIIPMGASFASAEGTPSYAPNMDWGPNGEGIFEISTPEDLLAFSKMNKSDYYGTYKDATVVLTNDIDLNPGWNASSGVAATNAWTPLNTFYGTFDGQGHTISGLYCKKNTGDNASFIVNGYNNTKIMNLNVENSYFESKNNSGFISVVRTWTTFENVYIDAHFVATEGGAGGFVATYVGRTGSSDTANETTPAAKFTNCVFAGTVSAQTFAGGILGSNDKTTSFVSANSDKGYGFGTFGATLVDCANYGTIEGTAAAGLIGICANSATITRCYGAGYADAALINAKKSTLATTSKTEGETPNPASIVLTDCYYNGGAALTSTSDAPAITMAYKGTETGEEITEIRSASVSELIGQPNFVNSAEGVGWVADADNTVAMHISLFCQALGHNYSVESVDNVCESYSAHTCKACGYSYTDGITTKQEHVEGEWIVDAAATADTDGSRHKECVNCHKTLKTETLPKLSSNYDTEWAPNENGVFEIYDAADLLAFSALSNTAYNYYSGKTVVLMNDIDLNPDWDANSGDAPANVWKPLDWFRGTFDGQGHTISGLYCKRAQGEGASFIVNGFNTKIKNLNVTNSLFESRTHTGFISKIKGWTTFENVYIDAKVVSTEGGAGGFAAALVGRMGALETSSESTPAVKFSSCVFAGTVTAETYAGGILGSNDKNKEYGVETAGKGFGYGNFATTLVDCANYGTVEATKAAGIIGICANTTNMTRCYNAGYTDTALINVQKSTLDPTAKTGSSALKATAINVFDCYLTQGTAITKTEDAPTVTVKYAGIVSDEAKTSDVESLIEISTYTKNEWKTNAAKTMAMPSALLCQSEGHSFETVTVELNCSSRIDHICSDCGYSYYTDFIDKGSHTESSFWVVDVEATQTSEGSKHKTCTLCGAVVRTEVTPVLGDIIAPNTDWVANEEKQNDLTVYEIYTAADLLALSEMRGKEGYKSYSNSIILLMNDIDLNPGWDANSGNAPANQWKPLDWFFGTLDGQGHTISGLYCKRESDASFIINGAGTKIKNLTVKNSYFESKNYAGFVAKIKTWTTFDNVYIDATVISTEGCAGGFASAFVGRAGLSDEASELTPAAKFTNCVFAGRIIAKTFAGGILGSNDKNDDYGSDTSDKGYGFGAFTTTLTDCANFGSIESLTGDKTAGLIAICANTTTMTRCYNGGNVATALINAQKSTLDTTSKNEGETPKPASIVMIDCYYLEGTALTKTSDAPPITLSYSDLDKDAEVLEIRRATVTELVTKSGFAPTENKMGWTANTDGTRAMPEYLLCQSTGHTFEVKNVETSCAEEGRDAHICSDCGFTYNTNLVEKLPHTESEDWVIDKEATTSYAGSKHKYCTECGATVKMEVIPKLKPTIDDFDDDDEPEDTDIGNNIETGPDSVIEPDTDLVEEEQSFFGKIFSAIFNFFKGIFEAIFGKKE